MGFSGGNEVFALNSYQIATICAVWGVVISAVYMLRAYRKIFLGTQNERWSGLPDLVGSPRIALTVLITVMLVTGFVPQLLVRLIKPAIFLQ